MPVPKIENVTPSESAVDSKVTIRGQNLKLTKTVKFGANAAKFEIKSDQEIMAIVPQSLPVGEVNVKVEDQDGKGSGKYKVTIIHSVALPKAANVSEKSTKNHQNMSINVHNKPTDLKSAQSQPIPVIAQESNQSTPVVTTMFTNNPRDLDRSRARFAWDQITSVKGAIYEREYSRLVRQLPTLIQINGLGQTLAFLKAKGESHHQQAFNHLSLWVCNHRFQWQDTDLLTKILAQDTDSQTYRLLTHESLAFLQWLKRFAEAELASEENSTTSEDEN